jgi:hypothetical protein
MSLGLVGAVVVSACSTGSDSITLSFQSKIQQSNATDLGSPGPSVGDFTSRSGDLVDASGAVIGGFASTAFINNVSDDVEARFVQAEYAFGEERTDSIVIMGAELFKTAALQNVKPKVSYAIVGGTGAYNGASGQCEVAVGEDDIYTVTCTFKTTD